MKALIGYTGFIGSILKQKINKANLYNSKNINKIKNKKFDEIICAGLPAAKWLANKYPSKDLKNTKKLINILKFVKCNLFILISTIDVKKNEPYGKNRKLFEQFISTTFPKFLIIRLPAVFGKGLKKNIIFDLLNNNQVDKINIEDKFQWFDISLLHREIVKIKKKRKFNKILELYSPPVSNKKILKFFPKIKIKRNNKKKINYNFKPTEGYFRNQKFIINRIKKFIENYEK